MNLKKKLDSNEFANCLLSSFVCCCCLIFWFVVVGFDLLLFDLIFLFFWYFGF